MPSPVARLAAALRDRYLIADQLGAGGMATVYRARDLRHDRDVALKLLRPELAAVVGGERFLTEIRTTAHLQHPNILPLFDSGEVDGLLYYVMPLVPGESLRDRLTREKELPVDESIRLAVEVAGALDYAHRQGIIHRDVKPENILLHDGRALVADFGIALAVRQAGGERVTETGLSLGTPQYMSPEQAAADRVLDGRSDQYSLACMLYEMLAGVAPHHGPSVQAIIASLMTTEPKPLAELRPGVPDSIAEAVHRALRKLPADRFATVAQFADALANPRATGSRSPGRRRRALGLVPWLVTAVAVAAAAMAWVNRPDPGTSERPWVTSINPPAGFEFDARMSFALSPDANRLVFRAISASGDAQLWLRSFDTTVARPLTGTEGGDWPFWSPDAKSIGFFASGELRRLDLADGRIRLLCPAPAPRGGAWNTAGVVAFAADGGLWRAPSTGGACERIARGERSGPVRPSWLPGGRRLLFSTLLPDSVKVLDLETGRVSSVIGGSSHGQFVAPRWLLAASNVDLRLLGGPLDFDPVRLSGPPEVLTGEVRNESGFLSVSVVPGALAYLESRPDSVPWETDRTGTVLLPTIDAPVSVWNYRATRDSRGLLFMSDAEGLWRLDLATRVPTRLGSTTGSSPVGGPAGEIVFLKWRTTNSTIRAVCDIVRWDPGRRTESVLLADRCLSPTDWSPDGRHLLLSSGSTPWLLDSLERAAIWRYSIADRSVEPLIAGPGAVRDGTFSPDGRWVAYSSDETGRPEIYLRRFDRTGDAVRVSRSGGRWPRWQGDGAVIYFLTPAGAVMSAPMTAAMAPAREPAVLFRHPGWTRSLFSDMGSVFDVTPDGNRFFLRRPTNPAYLTVVRNWARSLDAPAISPPRNP